MSKITDKFRLLIKKNLSFAIGLLYLYGTLSFLFDLEYVRSVFIRSNFPNPVMALLLIVFAGFGLMLGFAFISEKKQRSGTLLISVVYSLLLLVLNFYLTAAPSMSTCHCISFKESLWSVKDWSRVEFALVIFILNIIIVILNHSGSKSKLNNV